jgi:Fe-S-cluster containining protein
MNQLSSLLKEKPLDAYFEIRRLIGVVIENKKYKEAVKCGTATNCSFCCHDTIIMGKIEAEYIKGVIKSRKIIPNAHRVKQQNSKNPVKWMDKACPMLLDENEKGQRLCSIYNVRPLICRTHNSIMEPIECNKEDNPKKVLREAKSSAVDALSFTSFMLGNGPERKDPSETLVSMHEMLFDMIE